MARHTFITTVGAEKVGFRGHGVLTDVTYDDETVDIPSKSEIRKLITEEIGQVTQDINLLNRKLDEVAEQAKAATKDAAAAREAVERIVETARETFRDVIAELLAPHYRYLEEHLGIKPPDFENAKPKPLSKSKRGSISARSAAKPSPDKSQLAKGITDADEVESEGKIKRRVSKLAQKKAKSPQSKRVALQKKEVPAKSSAKSKGAKPCRKK